MADKGEDEKVTTNKSNTKKAGKLSFEAMYEQISREDPTLEANKSFWVRKGNSQKYTCILCNIGIQVSSNLSVFKMAILAHVGDKYHKKRYDEFLHNESNPKCEKQRIVKCKETKLMRSTQKCDDKVLKGGSNCPVDFDSIYKSFNFADPVVKKSKKFIVESVNGRHFFCNLCKVLIVKTRSATEFRYNLWDHINESSHRERLPNFLQMKEDFEKVMRDLSACYENEERFFEIGPVFRFVKCSICDEAVSVNLHRLKNHIRTEQHMKTKQSMMNGKSLETEPSKRLIRSKFKKLVARLADKFEDDVKYLKPGKLPGYVVCSLCCHVVLPTKFYIQTHLESTIHEENKTSLLI